METKHKMGTVNGIGTTLYGKAKKLELPPNERIEAEQHGFQPYTYQAVKWFTIFLVPVVPLGTYRVQEVQRSFLSSEPAQFRMWEAPFDWSQVLLHYALGVGLPLLLLIGFLYFETR